MTQSENYQALVIKAKISPHPNADRLVICSAMGYQVLVSKNVVDGQLLLFFEQGTQLSEDFCRRHKLLKSDGGMFDDNKRLVKAISLRGVRSEGFCIEAEKLGEGWEGLKAGDQISAWDGEEICRKYEPPQSHSQKAKTNRQQERTSKIHVKRAAFPEHVSTAHFRRELSHIPDGSILYVSEKLHGTSHRIGRIIETTEEPRFSFGNNKRINRWLRRIGGTRTRSSFITSHGTRHAYLGTPGFTGYYQNTSFRYQATEHIVPYENEIWYGEIVGYSGSATPIQKHSAGDKKEAKIWGQSIHYSYGNAPGACTFYCYRIIKMHENGRFVEYSWPQVQRRCDEMGAKTAPQFLVTSTSCNLNVYPDIDHLANGASPETGLASQLDASHPTEGVVVRVETPDGRTYWLKHKSYLFNTLEGRNMEAGVVDIEDRNDPFLEDQQTPEEPEESAE